MRAIAVAVPVPGLGPLTYTVPEGLALPSIGARVLVPLAKRTVTGIVVGASPLAPPDARPIIDVLDADAFLPPDVVTLAIWVADYYACGVGEAIATAMPPRAWIESERHARITEIGEARMLAERGARREVLELLSGGRLVSVGSLARKARGIQAVAAALEQDGLIVLTRPLKGAADASRTVRVAVLTTQGSESIDVEAGPTLGPRQQQ
ncbi:MAG TPA: hypothetical protein VNC21_00640, partial [Vicinamibacterales bacterium]|nr:hypothetical protein [Vicinamibacterales bacterium]